VIIRPAVKRQYTRLPNSLLRDRRLSADTRLMVALIVSKPPGWQIRPVPLMRELSQEETALGRHRLDRMFHEALAAKYMARSLVQGRDESGHWRSYLYIVGMPGDVEAEVARQNMAFLTHAAVDNSRPSSGRLTTVCDDGDSIKRFATDAHQDQLSRESRAQGLVPVWVGSTPYELWVQFRGIDGMPPVVLESFDGKLRRCCWLPSLYPPQHAA
jgi:hypothetical protein